MCLIFECEFPQSEGFWGLFCEHAIALAQLIWQTGGRNWYNKPGDYNPTDKAFHRRTVRKYRRIEKSALVQTRRRWLVLRCSRLFAFGSKRRFCHAERSEASSEAQNSFSKMSFDYVLVRTGCLPARYFSDGYKPIEKYSRKNSKSS